MSAHLRDWLHLALRWFHIIAGIAWIGNSLFFMWLDKTFTPPKDAKPGVAGELWMIHGGYFYRVEKNKPEPGSLPRVLHWFKWEATLTWISGFFLLIVTYYLGGLMIERSVYPLTKTGAWVVGLLTLAGGWLVYDLIWRALKRVPALAAILSLSALVGVAYGLSHVISGRAAFMHVGALLGTCMVLNVWTHILPPQRAMVAALEANKPADFSRGEAAKQRSTHNTYMTFPVIYVMLSNHFFVHFSHAQRWLVLVVVMLCGALVRHAMMAFEKKPAVSLTLIPVAVLGLVAMFFLTMPKSAGTKAAVGPTTNVAPPTVAPPPANAPGEPLPAERGVVKGTVRFTGAHAPASLEMVAECMAAHGGAAVEESIVADKGALANVVVHLSDGWRKWQLPLSTGEVVVDQHGCTYAPHVIAARVGQTVTLVNSDPFAHNVHGYAQDTSVFNTVMNKDERIQQKFTAPEIFAQLKCDIHPWMNAKVAVLEHPWFAVSDGAGAFRIEGIPPGDYTLEAVHETLGTKTQKIAVKAGEQAVEFTFP